MLSEVVYDRDMKRPQKQKPRVQKVQELRRSNAAGKHRTIKDYNRKDKSWLKEAMVVL